MMYRFKEMKPAGFDKRKVRKLHFTLTLVTRAPAMSYVLGSLTYAPPLPRKGFYCMNVSWEICSSKFYVVIGLSADLQNTSVPNIRSDSNK